MKTATPDSTARRVSPILCAAGFAAAGALAGAASSAPGTVTLAAPLVPLALQMQDDADGTEDVLYLTDGRELRGRIVEEDDNRVVFELVLAESGIRTRMTLLRDEITSIDRGVAKAEAAETESRRTRDLQTDKVAASQPAKTYGAHRSDVTDENLPSFYIVPVKGQMGTDVTPFVYREMLDDIRAADPDYLVLVVECRDFEDKVIYADVEDPEKGFASIEMIDRYRDLVNFFRDELNDIEQCVWIHDSVGISSALAFAWNEIYMTPDARLGGVSAATKRGFDFENFADEDVKGKMREAYMAFLRGFAEYSDVVPEIIDAMVRSEFMLSGSWKGREVNWTADNSGQYIVDQSEQETASFRAKTAEDLCLSSGTAENLDDLALLLGYREYRVVDGKGEKIFDDYVEDWRRKLQMVKDLWAEFQETMSWSGENPVKYLGKAKQILRRIVAAIDQYEAVETRVLMELGLRRFDLITQIEMIEEQIKALRRGGRGGGGGGRSGGGAGPGSGGG